MTIDKPTLDKAKKWAGEILDRARPHQYADTAIAAAEVIRDLPAAIVDGDKVREVINAQLDSHPHGTVGHQVAEELACKLQALLPTSTPQVEIALGAWAMHPEHGKVLIAGTEVDEDEDVRIFWEAPGNVGGSDWRWVPVTDLSPLPDAQDDSEEQSEYAPGGVLPERTSAEKEQMHRTLEKLNQQYTEPQPGEAWETDRYGQHMIRRENGWIGELGTYEDEYCPITPLRRLVPAQEPRVLTTVEDYENAAVGTVISYPALVDGDFEPDWIDTAVKYGDGHWYSTGEAGFDTSEYLSGTSRTVLWEPEA